MGGGRTDRAQLWAVGAVALVTLLLAALSLRRTGGVFVYVLDDPAIHLTVARRLAYDGTWGVVPGQFQSASSSPLWTLLLAATQLVVRGRAGEYVPLVLNVAAALVVVRLLAPELRRFDPFTAVVVGVVFLFLPGLAFMGMEHTLHMALVLAAVLAVERRQTVPAMALVFLAALTRGETVFVVVGLVVALGVVGSLPWRRWLLAAVQLGGAAAVALGTVAVCDLAFGQEVLPNSVMAKSFGARGDTRRSLGAAWERLWTDPLLAVLLLLSLALVVAAWRRKDWSGPALFPAVVVVVATLLHVELAAVSRSLRYEGYLLGIGVLVFLRALPELVRLVHRSRWPVAQRVGPAVLVLALVPFAALQVIRTAQVPDEVGVMYEQRYQVARFLDDSYDTDAVAIGELGYIGLYHDGPLTDIYGLGDHEVLTAHLDDRDGPGFWRQLQRQRGFRVVAMFDFSIREDIPDDWILVGSWRSPEASFEVTDFWAAVPEEVGALREDLERYEAELPADVEVSYNALAPFLAADRMTND
jgi:hypothetical protein